ncbi:hypothetical protein FE257_007843 [Aspergillus nanangensis]|uniref:AB hydrolase-1 domain-containing protein n=1 Tax=Aspergillus nanangensis TaxID=2582783 RepID=A0AAD4GZ33_ASPNN|nr:hypothetical protein FE257_007843 [Aspergillus nanangensis]
MPPTQLHTIDLPTTKTKVFYRESGPPTGPVILLLHGFPSSSHQYRNLIPLLATKYHVIAPDLPGFGFTFPPQGFSHTFANLTTTILEFLDTLHIPNFSVYMFDYGAPIGLRIALQRPHAIQALISQNGNAYEAGLDPSFWAPVRALWTSDNGPEIRAQLAEKLLSYDATKWQYEEGTREGEVVAPEAYTLDYALLQRPGSVTTQLDLLWDYQRNVELYPQFQEYFRKSQVPLLAVWGRNDRIFGPDGAEAFRTDLPGAEVHLLEAGHFAAETETEEVGRLVGGFLDRVVK